MTLCQHVLHLQVNVQGRKSARAFAVCEAYPVLLDQTRDCFSKGESRLKEKLCGACFPAKDEGAHRLLSVTIVHGSATHCVTCRKSGSGLLI